MAIEDYTATGLTVKTAIQTLLVNDLTELFLIATEVINARDGETNLLAQIDSLQALIAAAGIDFESTGIDDNATSTAMTIDASENIGIGTTSPSKLLHVSSSSNGELMRVESTAGADNHFFSARINQTAGSVIEDNLVTLLSTGVTAGDLAFGTGVNERIRITATGFFGIGIAAPTKVLHAYHATLNDIALFESGDATCLITLKDNTGEIDIYSIAGNIGFNTDSTAHAFYIKDDGKVGIGTTSPDQTLHVMKGSAGTVASTADTVITLENSADCDLQLLSPSSDICRINFGDESDNNVGRIYYNHVTDSMTFVTASVGQFFISSGGVASFAQFPITPSSAPTTDYQVANKKHVDDTVGDASNIADGSVSNTEFQRLDGVTSDIQPQIVDLQSQLYLFPQRSVFSFKDVDEIYLGTAVYNHIGTTTQRLYWDSQLTFQFANLGVSDWSYLYLDDSAIVTADTNVITASQLIDSVTEPTWSAAKRGWYNGSDRCIFAVFTNGSSQILEFFNDDALILLADAITVESNLNTSASFANISAFTMPVFARKVLAYSAYDYTNINTRLYWRTDGQTGSNGHQIGRLSNTASFDSCQFTAITGSNHIIEMKEDDTTTNTVNVTQDGWFMPIGM